MRHIAHRQRYLARRSADHCSRRLRTFSIMVSNTARNDNQTTKSLVVIENAEVAFDNEPGDQDGDAGDTENYGPAFVSGGAAGARAHATIVYRSAQNLPCNSEIFFAKYPR
jgi:hypothetical protein